MFSYGEKIYELLSKELNIKFKAQIKDSGIEFKKFYKMIDLENQKEQYLLFLDDTNIVFNDKKDFVNRFLKYIEDNLTKLDYQSKILNKKLEDSLMDKSIFYDKTESEYIGHYSYKQERLKKRLIELFKT